MSSNSTLEEYWHERFMRAQKGSPLYRKTLNYSIEHQVLSQIGKTKLKDIDRIKMVELFQGLAVRSRDENVKVRACLKVLFEDALEDGLISKNPMRRVPNYCTREVFKRFLTEDEFHRLLRELKPRDRLICYIAIALGLRPGELFALKWANFNPAGWILINESYCLGEWKPTKTKASTAWMPVVEPLLSMLIEWREAQAVERELIFPARNGVPITYGNYLMTVIQPAAIRAGIMEAKPADWPKGKVWAQKKTSVNFQVMRRTCATWIKEEGGVDAARDMLRHTDGQITSARYIGEVDGAAARAQRSIVQKMLLPTTINTTAV